MRGLGVGIAIALDLWHVFVIMNSLRMKTIAPKLCLTYSKAPIDMN